MKILTTILILLAVALIIFNATFIDFENPTKGNSFAAIVGSLGSLCAVFILIIFKMSKKIEDKLRG